MTELNLLNVFNRLNMGASEAVQSGFTFSSFDKYMHVERNIETELLAAMKRIEEANGGIVLLVGSAGDGKSHLISRIKYLNQFDWNDDCFYNDATASCSPDMTAIETLKEELADFSDKNIDSTNKKLVLAINLGKLSSFIDDEIVKEKYTSIVDAASFVFPEKKQKFKEHPKISIVLFLNEQFFEFKPQVSDDYDSIGYPVESNFFSKILKKITTPSEENEFYVAYLNDLKSGISSNEPIVINYRLLSLPNIQKTIVLSLIEVIIRFDLKITTREFFDFIYSIMVYPKYDSYDEKNDFFDALLPNLFYSIGGNAIKRKMYDLDPLKYSSSSHDNKLSLLFTSCDYPQMAEQIESDYNLPSEIFYNLRLAYDSFGKKNSKAIIEKSRKSIFRLEHMLTYHSESLVYKSFLSAYSGYLLSDSMKLAEIYNMISKALPRHFGSYCDCNGLIPLDIQGSDYRFFVNRQLIQHDDIKPEFSKDKPSCFQLIMSLGWTINTNVGPMVVGLDVDYKLYSYIYDLLNGKIAMGYNSEKNLVFCSFVKKLLLKMDSNQPIVIVKSDGSIMNLTKNHRSISLQ